MVLYVLPVGLMKIAPDVNLKNVQDETSLKRLERGGHYKPSDCEPREKTAIVIPYRDREQHLKVWLNNLKGKLRTAKGDY